jgi:hypothetical protein
VVSGGKFVRVGILRPAREKITSSGNEEWLKKTELKGSSSNRLKPNEFLNGDVGFTVVNPNFGK